MHARSYLNAVCARDDLDEILLLEETNRDLAHQIAAQTGVSVASGPAEFLERVDAVIITSDNVHHAPLALAAARAGVHALVEKPLATRIPDAVAMVEAYRQASLVLATSFPCPFSPAFQALAARARAGELGDVLALRCTNRGTMPGGFFIERERSGGGAVIDHAVHVADLLRRITGRDPQRVYAEIGHGLYHQDWDDSGLLTIEMSGGTFSTLDCSWSRPGSFPTWGDVTIKLIGSEASATADLFGQRLEYYPAEPARPKWIGWGSDLDALLIDDFLEAIRAGRQPVSSGEDGLWALRVALAAYASAQAGAPVDVLPGPAVDREGL